MTLIHIIIIESPPPNSVDRDYTVYKDRQLWGTLNNVRTYLGQISTVQGSEILAFSIVQNSASANNDANSEYTKTKTNIWVIYYMHVQCTINSSA
jgi:hypothetical protein